MFDSRNVSRLVVLGCHDATLVFVFPRLAEVDLLPVRVSQPAAQGVEDGRPGTDVPLLDHRGVDVDILVSCSHLPHLSYRDTISNEQRLNQRTAFLGIVQSKYSSIVVYEDYDQAVASFESGTGR